MGLQPFDIQSSVRNTSVRKHSVTQPTQATLLGVILLLPRALLPHRLENYHFGISYHLY